MKLLALVIALLLIATPAVARYRVRRMDDRERAAAELGHQPRADPRRVLWIATLGGLVRFDGVTFTCSARSRAAACAASESARCVEDRAGALWMATERGGLTRYATDRSPPISPATACRATASVPLRGSRRNTVGRHRPRSRPHRRTAIHHVHVGRACRPITSSPSPTGRAACGWEPTRAGPHSRWRFTTFTVRDGLPGDEVLAVWAGRDGTVWVGTGAGLLERRPGATRLHRQLTACPAPRAAFLRRPRRGHLDRHSVGHGTADAPHAGERQHERPARLDEITTRDGLSDDDVHALLEDREGNIWIGTNTGGLNRLTTAS